MRDYARVAPTFWTRGSGKKLRGYPDAQVVALYLMTCQASTMIGIFYLSMPTLAHETGLPIDRARAALDRVIGAEIAMYDEEAELVFLPGGAKYQVGQPLRGDDKRIRGIERELKTFGDHPFVSRFVDRYRRDFSLTITAVSERFAEAPPKPLRSPLEGASKPSTSARSSQDQAQEQTPVLPPEPGGSGSLCGIDDHRTSPTQPPPEAPADEPPASPAQEPAEAPQATGEPPEVVQTHPEHATAAPRPGPGEPTLFADHGPDVAPKPARSRRVAPDDEDHAAAVFEHYLAGWRLHVRGNRPPKLDTKRRRLVRQRLDEGWSGSELKRACDGLWLSAWHIENKRTDFDLVMRDTTHVEMFLDKHPAASPPPPAFAEAELKPDPRIYSVPLPPELKTPDDMRLFVRSAAENLGRVEGL